MKYLVATILVLTSSSSYAQLNGYNRPSINNTYSAGAGGSTSPGGSVTGANQYRTSSGTFGGDNAIIDNGSGVLTAAGVSASNVSAGLGSTASATLTVSGTSTGDFGGLLIQGTNGSRFTLSPAGSASVLFKLQQSTGSMQFQSFTSEQYIRIDPVVNALGIRTATPTVPIDFGQNAGFRGTLFSVGNTFLGGSATATVQLQISGTTYSTGLISTSSWVNVGSPTTLPTCNTANKGNVFMNTTTNCLNYCDGTANRQITSVAATCT